MMALASSAYYFLSYLAKKDGDSCLLVTFTIVIVLICEVRRGPIYVSNGNMNSNLITGTRTCSLKSAELPFILLFAVIVYYMLYGLECDKVEIFLIHDRTKYNFQRYMYSGA